jgi:phytanoyl-CoA hydroxylase
MYIFKPPEIGGKVKPHQDSSFLYTEPSTCTGFWIPLDDVDQENGCLWFIPGSHTLPLEYRFKRDENDELYYDPPLNYEYLEEMWPKEFFIPIEARKGSLVIFHGNLVHMSDENKSDKPRHVYTFHVVDNHSYWSEENWLQYPDDTNFDTL